MAKTFDELEKKLLSEGKLKSYNKELSAYIKKHVHGKIEFVIPELVAHGKGVKEPFANNYVTKKVYVEYLKEKFKDEKDDIILSRGC